MLFRSGFDLDAKRLEKQLREELGIEIKDLRLINCYDIFNLNADKENVKKMILSEPVTDSITEELDLKGKKYFAVEFLPGQFDQRADSAIQCIDIVSTVKQNVDVLTSKIIILNDELSDEELNRIKKFRSEEHTSELQSPDNLVCRLLLEKKYPDSQLLFQ